MERKETVYFSASFSRHVSPHTDVEEQDECVTPPDFVTGGLLEPAEEDRKLGELYVMIAQLEQGLQRQASNLQTLSKGERMPFPGVSVELLQEKATLLRERVEELCRTVVWTVSGWYRLHDAVSLRLLLAEKQVAIFAHEREMLMLKSAGDLANGARFVAAVFVRQPRSQPVKRAIKKAGGKGGMKKAKANMMYELRIVGGAVTEFTPDTRSLHISLTQLEAGRIKGQKAAALQAELTSQEWHEDGRSCSLSVMFPDGTQVMPSLLNVEVSGRVKLPLRDTESGDPIEVAAFHCTTCNALPMVVCTNENQWEQAEGRIVRRQIFGDAESSHALAPWVLVANYLSEFFLRATRQDLLDAALLPPETLAALPVPQRALSDRDLAYLQRVKFNGEDRVSAGDYAAFFEWYGPACHHFRHNALVRGLMLQGLIFGLADQKDCTELLTGREPGHFLIYLNETSKMGDYCLAFVHPNGRVLFHKIDAKKLRAPFGSLADYVRDKKELRMLVKPFHCLPSGTKIAQLVAVEKHEAFREWYAPLK